MKYEESLEEKILLDEYMKTSLKALVLTMFILMIGSLVWGDGLDDFTNSNATSSYANNSFVGNNGITWTSYSAGTPSITISESSLSGFSYQIGNGPSAEQTFDVSGTNLTGNVTASAHSDYEISNLNSQKKIKIRRER